MKNYIFIIALTWNLLLCGECKRADNMHVNKDVVRCKYYQEDIFKCYSKKLHCYPELERRKECFFCECPIEEHKKFPVPPSIPPAKKIRRR